MRIIADPFLPSPAAPNPGRIAPVRPVPRQATVDPDQRPGENRPPEEPLRVGQLLPPAQIPTDRAAAARFIGGRPGAVYHRLDNAVQLVEQTPAISAYLQHRQADPAVSKVGTLFNSYV